MDEGSLGVSALGRAALRSGRAAMCISGTVEELSNWLLPARVRRSEVISTIAGDDCVGIRPNTSGLAEASDANSSLASTGLPLINMRAKTNDDSAGYWIDAGAT